ncbi:glycosyltransferase [Flavobacterium sp. LPB0248]|uniref:glycosyltransferase family 2 protein n=1 Tax=Flavobacterium sp. LPB0248 TaxID=2614441 RepID=UPI0015A6DB31|nr:glycosyltransferase [Flavobacterium sp. LPB0248]QLC67481.1 glycosyltransferase [Flavobacterium sp. LPB0248]
MNNISPFFSIIIPTYNHAHFIKKCLDSLLSQSYQNWEAIIVNNFSEDTTIEIVESYEDSRIRLINNANNGIIAVSRNKGIAEAKGDWICFLDSDDWWYSNKLESILPFLNNYDFLYHNLDRYYDYNKPNGKMIGRELDEDIVRDVLLRGNRISNSSVVIRKSIVDQVGYLSEDKELVAIEDADYWIRTGLVTNKFKLINISLGGYWIGGGNLSYSIKHIQKEENLLNKYIGYLKQEDKKEAFFRFYFSSARKYHCFGMYKEANKEYLKSIKSKQLELKLKSFVGLFFSTIHFKM